MWDEAAGRGRHAVYKFRKAVSKRSLIENIIDITLRWNFSDRRLLIRERKLSGHRAFDLTLSEQRVWNFPTQ